MNFTGEGRDKLLERIAWLEHENAHLDRQCTELLLEARSARQRGRVRITFLKDGTAVAQVEPPRGACGLPGWDCPNSECGAFNGDAKERLEHCRCCSTARPQ